MIKNICLECKKPAELKKVNQINTITYICKSCAINEIGANEIGNNKIKCDKCQKSSKYMLITQLNRIRNLCEECLLENYTSI
ncbi:hypothetical protein [Spiroplasma diminutum]|uniref:Uncharacterized protein n=1 Tax=Spiroplasma diminutum CUAS-1 TaxID=1276221 RepID=S5M2G7_9MOLU|nr:hypothetical protein [Spiroplasma diminutum]AGR42277.1 hypothetical protein SDIMI_v3c05730 [Spiroplasma diminutum CUAS-1]